MGYDKITKLMRLRLLADLSRHFIGGLIQRADKHHIFLLAGGLAFSLFVCIVPLVLIIFAVMGSILEQPSIAEEINSFIDNVIPYQDYAAFAKEFVFQRIEEFRGFKRFAGVIGIIGLVFAASGLFSSMRTVLNTVYRVRANGTVLTGKLRDFGLVLLVLLYFLLSTTLLPTLEIVRDFADRVELLQPFRFGLTEDLMIGMISFAVIFLAFFIIYFAVPNRKQSFRKIIVSAFSAALLWEIAKQIFGFYIAHVVTIKKIYGAYALMIVVAFWIYYTSIVFILGAEIGQLYRDWQMKRRLRPRPDEVETT